MNNHTDVLNIHTRICGGAQILLIAVANLRFATQRLRKNCSGMED